MRCGDEGSAGLQSALCGKNGLKSWTTLVAVSRIGVVWRFRRYFLELPIPERIWQFAAAR